MSRANNSSHNVGKSLEEGRIYYKAKKYEKALVAYREAIGINPTNAIAYVGQGNCFYKQEQYDLALNAYEQAIHNDPKNVAAYNGRSYVYIKKHLKETSLLINYRRKADLANKKALALNPENAAAHNARGQLLEIKEKYQGALESFEEAIKLATNEDNLAGYYYNKAFVLNKLGRYENALKMLNIAIVLDYSNPRFTKLHTEIIAKYNSQGYHENSFGERQPGNIFEHLGKGKALSDQQHYEEALKEYDLALLIDPSNVLAHTEKGNNLLKINRYQEAIRAYDEALKKQANFTFAHVGKGHALYALNYFAKALKSYEEAINLNTSNVFCYIYSGDILIKEDHYNDALQIYDKAIHFENLPQPFYIGRGRALFGLERYSEAHHTYLQAATFQTHKTEVHLRLGDILTIFNKPDEAAEEYKKCLRLAAEETDPDELWFLASTLKCSHRPADVQLELFYYFLEVRGADPHLHQIFSHLGTLYEQLFDTHRDSGGVCFKSIEMLHKMLMCLSEDKREDALTLIGQSKNRYIAQLLILLKPFALPGLTRLARNIATEWEYTAQDDELVIPFFSVLDGYQVAPSDRDLFLARYYMAKGFYAWAEPLLSQLIQQEQSDPESIWLKAQALRGLQQSPHEQVQLLESFITLLPTDKRVAQAYLAIGDLYGEYLEDGLKSVEAYKAAERLGMFVPQLQAFRQGKWDVIPALRKHTYFAYPPIVVIDLECDYEPDGPTRSSIFEVGAVRIKGDFIIDEYEAIIQTESISEKFRYRRREAKALEQVTQELLKFIEQSTLDKEAPAIVAGHNLRLFDAEYLDIMGIELNDAQIVDTLEFARLLYPESLHHHLELLCHAHEISFEGNAHEALPDARACAHLSYALGEELLKRGEHLLAGFRAFVSPGSAFDRAILQPRGIRIDPTHPWELDPAPTSPHILGSIEGASASSPHILAALASKRDALIESDDRNAAYVQHLSGDQRTVVVVNTRTRLERILTMSRRRNDHFVLPDFRTLLCPHLLRRHIEQAENHQIKLELFCLYQASHNHDARTLYPLRISSNKTALTDKAPLTNLRELLLASCCASDWSHAASCEAVSATEAAIDQHTLLLATHENFLALPSIYQPRAETIIIDEIDKLQLHFAEYLADQLTNQQLQSWSTEIFQLLHAQITAFSQEYAGRQGFRERHYMRNIVPYLISSENDEKKSLLVQLKEAGPIGKHVAQKLQNFCDAAMREREDKEAVHAYWLDLEFEQETRRNIEQWRFCGLSRTLPEAFHESFWAPYKQHIICGTAITLGNLKTKFLQRFFGLPEEIDFYKDENASSSRSRVYVPPIDVLRPASFLARRSWAESIGNFLYSFALSQQRSFVVSLNETTIAHALANALNEESRQKRLPYQILSPHLKWTTAKIAKRLARSGKQTITILSPHARKTMLDDNIDIEVTGPIRFLNQRDPLVAAQMQVFAQKYKDEGPISAYLLPQALLELKSRLSTQAKLHIILDSSLRAKVYQDEVFSLFNEREIVNTLPGVLEALRYPSQSFLDCLRLELDGQGISNHTDIAEKDLYLTLQTVWGEKTFREEPDQKKIVHDVLAGKDQLVIAATGGGKSLCFQLPAILMAQDVVPKVTLIFSPLIALMEDQVNMLRSKGVFTAIRWNSTLPEAERQDYQRGIKQGDYSIIYIAPEQIHTSKLRKALETREVGLIAFDEAHCVSQWGHDFRTDYFAVKNWINTQICAVEGQRNFPLLALTATARKGYRNPDNGYSESSTIQDIIHNLRDGSKPCDTFERSGSDRRKS